jgi:hypothetical protein
MRDLVFENKVLGLVVSFRTLSAMTDGSSNMTTTSILPPALETITKKLKFEYRGPAKVGRFATYEVDLSDWSLNLSDANPFIWVQASDLAALSVAELANSLTDVVRERGWQNEVVVVLADGEVMSLRDHLPRALPTFVVLDAKQQARIQQADSPTAATLDLLLGQMPLSQLAPYETNKPVVGGQFFGRAREINQVLQHPATNFLFIGIRRIGKTSLLKEIKRRMDHIDPPHENQIRRLYVDCTVLSSQEEFLRTITVELDPSELKLLLGRAAQSKRYQRLMFDRFVSLHGGPVTFLVDELDRLLAQIGYEADLFDVLRAASNAGKARFIMAGFRRAMLASRKQQSPFFNLAKDIRIGRLKRSDVKQLVLIPLERLRVEIQNKEGVVNRINRETAGLPNYVQYYCKTLLEHVEESGRNVITEEDLGSVYENREFTDFVLNTFVSNTQPLERALVYAIVSEDESPTKRQTYSQRTMDGFLKKRRLNLKYEQLDNACRSLEVAGVFNQVGKNFEFAIPLFRRMLRTTRDVDFLFDKTREEIMTAGLLA